MSGAEGHGLGHIGHELPLSGVSGRWSRCHWPLAWFWSLCHPVLQVQACVTTSTLRPCPQESTFLSYSPSWITDLLVGRGGRREGVGSAALVSRFHHKLLGTAVGATFRVLSSVLRPWGFSCVRMNSSSTDAYMWQSLC